MAVRYKKRFLKHFKKLLPKVKDRFYQQLEIFLASLVDQHLHNHTVDTAFPGCRSIDVTGDYRAIFKEEDGDTVFVDIDTHSNLY